MLLKARPRRLAQQWLTRKSQILFDPHKLTHTFGIVHIRKTKNNLHMNISNLIGIRQVKWHASCGTVLRGRNGLRKKRKAQLKLFKRMKSQLDRFGIRYLILEIFGHNRPLHIKFVNATLKKPYKILAFKHCIAEPHNGCRPPKLRKV